MKIFGHSWIASEPFYKVYSIEEIRSTPSNSLLQLASLSSSLELAQYCQVNHLRYMLEVQNIKEALFANLLGATFIRCQKGLAEALMPIAQNYLFDTQVLAEISDEEEIEILAKAGVDGVIFK
ncbi:hypothetical protein KKC13_10155 [bacterium]|nr:hypothetical protein [bacterium]MBU1958366.1 hypothetical protein [bacterium]